MRIVYFLLRPDNILSDAALNRISLFCKGFNELDVDNSIFLISSYKGKNRFKLYLSFLYNCAKILTYIYFCLNSSSILIFYGESPYYCLFPIINRRNKILVERNEYPWFVRNQSTYGSSQLKYVAYTKGLITCSSFLRSYYSEYVIDENRIFISPLIVDTNKFDVNYNPDINKDNNIILYCGNFNNNKDGVPILIEAFGVFHNKFPNYTLYLIGGGNKKTEKELKDKVEKMRLSESVIFPGFIPHDQIIKFYQKASIFALARPHNKQAEGGIPSKLAEYMAMKRPCVITAVGDIPSLFDKDIDCYIAQPSSVEDFAYNLIKCAEADNRVMISNAYNKILKYDFRIQAENLYDFLKNKIIDN